MIRGDFSLIVCKQLVRLPKPYESHYGVVPLPPHEDYIALFQIAEDHKKAMAAITKIDLLAQEISDPYIISLNSAVEPLTTEFTSSNPFKNEVFDK